MKERQGPKIEAAPQGFAPVLRPSLERGKMPEALKTQLRREHFAREYLLDLNGTQAAIRAGYSAKTAAQAASRMLRNVKVRALMKELIGRILENCDLHQRDVPRKP